MMYLKASFTTLVITFLFMVAIPLTVSAAPAFVNVSMDRTTISQGETVTFSIRATPQTTFVFANVDGTRTQGTRMSGNEWSITVSPSRTTVVSIFANNSNNETNAAVMNVPVTVSGSGTSTPTTPVGNVVVPPAPPNLGPLAIASVTETPATRQGFVQLTVVTGNQVADVWANFDRANNTRATGRFARATMLSQDTNSRTWVIDFDPAVWAAQTIEIGANRTYTWPGATTQQYTLILSQPFVAPAAPRINSVNASPRTVSSGNSTTLTIATNLDVEHVWIRDVDGREFNAHRTTSTASARNWSVNFSPNRTGTVRVFANSTRTETGAATRNETITVGGSGSGSGNNWSDGDAQIIGTPTARLVGGDTTRIEVTTNRYAETVWATLPGNQRISLHRTNSGTGNRTWETEAWDISSHGSILISVSSVRGNINNLHADDTRTVNRSSWGNDWGSGQIFRTAHWSGGTGSRNVRRGREAEFRVTTSTDVTIIDVNHQHGIVRDAYRVGGSSGGEQEWFLAVEIRNSAPNTVHFTVEAFVGSSRVDTRQLPPINVTD